MGKKGSKLSADAESVAANLLESLASLGDVSSKKMFGGLGIFESGTMFGIVDSKGAVFFRAGDANTALFEQAGSHRHGKMPYYSVPDSVLGGPADLLRWGKGAIEASRAAKKA